MNSRCSFLLTFAFYIFIRYATTTMSGEPKSCKTQILLPRLTHIDQWHSTRVTCTLGLQLRARGTTHNTKEVVYLLESLIANIMTSETDLLLNTPKEQLWERLKGALLQHHPSLIGEPLRQLLVRNPISDTNLVKICKVCPLLAVLVGALRLSDNYDRSHYQSTSNLWLRSC